MNIPRNLRNKTKTFPHKSPKRLVQKTPADGRILNLRFAEGDNPSSLVYIHVRTVYRPIYVGLTYRDMVERGLAAVFSRPIYPALVVRGIRGGSITQRQTTWPSFGRVAPTGSPPHTTSLSVSKSHFITNVSRPKTLVNPSWLERSLRITNYTVIR